MPPSSDVLSGWLEQRLGVRLLRARSVAGGSIHAAWCLELATPLAGQAHLFAKTAPADGLPLLEAEADGLAALAAAAADTGLLVPQPLAWGPCAGGAVLVLPWLELQGRGGSADWAAFGSALARLHRGSIDHGLVDGDRPGTFGWRCDNVIGATPQRNDWQDDWAGFFGRCRLAPQLELLARRGIVLAGAKELLERLPSWLAGHAPAACLVHGDLWSGNAALLPGAVGALFDPAVHRGDREVDLAMAQLFGGFPAAFFDGYTKEWPLPAGHRQRLEIYNLYHLLNHATLFGGGYVERSRATIATLLHR